MTPPAADELAGNGARPNASAWLRAGASVRRSELAGYDPAS
jgi:hypothetical protein